MSDIGYDAALAEAEMGAAEEGVPIGAALVRDGRVVGRGHNMRVQKDDPTAHAEIECLRAVGRTRGLHDSVLYTTLTPCHMCTGAILLFGIRRVVVGEIDSYDGEGSLDLLKQRGVQIDILADPKARELMREFAENQPDLWAEDIGK